MSNPTPPVGGIFRPDGLFLTLVESGSFTSRLLTWDELYKLAKRGKKETTTGALKDFTKKVSEVVKSNDEFMHKMKVRKLEQDIQIAELKNINRAVRKAH